MKTLSKYLPIGAGGISAAQEPVRPKSRAAAVIISPVPRPSYLIIKPSQLLEGVLRQVCKYQ